MSIPFKADVSGEARIAYQTRFLAGLRGERGPVIFSEQKFSTLEMPELDANADAADAAAAGGSTAEHAYLSRIKLILALAVQRDARYAHANRRFLFALGANNKLRGDFEAFAAAAKTIGALP